MTAHQAIWTSPAPLWGRFLTAGGRVSFAAGDQTRPAILRFATDDFMDQLLATLAAEPRGLADAIARPETWRSPAADPPPPPPRRTLSSVARGLARLRLNATPRPAIVPTSHEDVVDENGVARTLPLKLYQAAHQRHYLVAASLACRLPGFPDRTIDAGTEQAGFVLRRLLPHDPAAATSPLEEFAFVKDASGARWQRVAPAAGSDPGSTLAEGEELLPLFPLHFRDDVGHGRRLLAGVVPVGRRDEYMSTRAQRAASGTSAGSPASPPPGTTAMTARKEQLKLDVVEPWKNVVRSAFAAAAQINDNTTTATLPDAKKIDAARAANELAQGQSWLILLDFADYLAVHLPPVWQAVLDPSNRSQLTTDAQRNLFDWLNGAAVPASGWQIGSPAFATSLRDALARVRTTAVRNALERAEQSYPAGPAPGHAWPGFLYLLAGVRQTTAGFGPAGAYQSLASVATGTPEKEDQDPVSGAAVSPAEAAAQLLDKVVQLVIRAIDTTAPASAAPPVPFPVTLREALKSTDGDPGWFVLRCAYVRPECGPLHPPILSAPSQRFQLAGFFDPDAPARPIRIALPLDTTPAGLRKFNKNTALMMSDVLCGQVQRAKGLGLVDLVRAVLPWPLHKDLDVGGMGPCRSGGDSIGMICSLSIPIITICALILLLIIVTLLDLIFRWIPFFIICFPVPGLKAKR